jgi:hypothetical protein
MTTFNYLFPLARFHSYRVSPDKAKIYCDCLGAKLQNLFDADRKSISRKPPMRLCANRKTLVVPFLPLSASRRLANYAFYNMYFEEKQQISLSKRKKRQFQALVEPPIMPMIYIRASMDFSFGSELQRGYLISHCNKVVTTCIG